MKATFLDTGYVLALELASDQNHQAAIEHWRRWGAVSPPLVTTSYVFDEIVTFSTIVGIMAKLFMWEIAFCRVPQWS